MEKQKHWAGWLIVALVVAVAAVAIAMTNTNEPTQPLSGELAPHEAELRALYPEADAGDAGFVKVDGLAETEGRQFTYEVKQNGQTAGYVLKQTVQGYRSPIEVLAGFEADGKAVRGVRAGGAEFSETAGLGSRVQEPKFTDQFAGKVPPLSLGEDIEGITGATISSRAVVDAVNNAAQRLAGVTGGGEAPSETADGGRTANASTIGYGGPVLVRLTLDDAGKIAKLDVGGARFSETEGVGSRVRDEAFTGSFIGLTPPLTLGKDVDGISGATVSSQAVVDAVNEAAAFLNGEDVEKMETTDATEGGADTAATPEGEATPEPETDATQAPEAGTAGAAQ